jgi:hypothetical protein
MFSTDSSKYFILPLSPTHCFQVLEAKNHIRAKTTKDTRKKDELEKEYRLRLIVAICLHLHPTTECKMKRL